MHKTETKILEDVFFLLRDGGIEDVINGSLYIKTRPANSNLEDCVIKMIASTDSDFQIGGITVNIWVPNITVAGNNGFLVENTARTGIISEKLNEIVHNKKLMCARGEYWFNPTTVVTIFPVEEQDAHFHVVNAQFDFSRFSYDKTL